MDSHIAPHGKGVGNCVSKNDETTALAIWDKLYGRRFPITDFAATRINWSSKPENVREILDAVNLLPSSVLFVDDNPVERAAVKAAFPAIRVLDAPLAQWRRILLWAPELQRSAITAESARRTEMVQAQIAREGARHALDRKAFLESLSVVLKPFPVARSDDPRFARCLELLNKTNQFNTTGKRWTPVEIERLFAVGGRFLAFDVQDRFTAYGMTALLLIAGDTIEQFVMSCRVFGMEVEKACIAVACGEIAAAGETTIKGRIKATGKNLLSMTIFADQGFEDVGDGLWVSRETAARAFPAHIAIAPPA